MRTSSLLLCVESGSLFAYGSKNRIRQRSLSPITDGTVRVRYSPTMAPRYGVTRANRADFGANVGRMVNDTQRLSPWRHVTHALTLTDGTLQGRLPSMRYRCSLMAEWLSLAGWTPLPDATSAHPPKYQWTDFKFFRNLWAYLWKIDNFVGGLRCEDGAKTAKISPTRQKLAKNRPSEKSTDWYNAIY